MGHQLISVKKKTADFLKGFSEKSHSKGTFLKRFSTKFVVLTLVIVALLLTIFTEEQVSAIV